MNQSVVQALCIVMSLAAAAAANPLDAAAQAASGRVLGRVFDAETGRPLPGAQLSIEGTRAGSLAGIDGRYVIVNVPSGEQSLVVSYIGYATKTVTGIEVPVGSAVAMDVTLASAAVAIEGITVSAERERGSVSRALDAQRSALGVTSAISAEQIGRSPDSDAAAAIQRVSGVTVQDGKYVFVRGLGERYTTTSLNGARVPSAEPERKMVPLDLFPAGLLQAITTSKTFTPDLPGDFSGAQVDIRTREFPARRQLSVSLSSGYNSEVTGKTLPMAPRAGGEWLAVATGRRAIPQIVEQTSRPQPGSETNAMVNAIRNSWSVVDQTGRPSSSLGLSLGGSDELLGRTIGYLASAAYSAGDEVNVGAIRENPEGDRYEGTVGRTSVLWGGLLNLSTLLGTHTRVSLNNTYNRSADNEARFETGFYENHGTNLQIERLRYVERVVRSNQLLLEHQLTPRQRLDWSVTTSAVSRQEPDRSEFVTWLDPTTPTWYNQEGSFRAYGGLTEASLEAAANYQLELGGAGRHVLRFGALLRRTDRDAYDKGYSIRSREWSATDPRWQLRPEEFFDGRFSSNGETLFEMGIFNAGGGYGAADRLAAGYSMLELGLASRLRLIGGARLERSAVTIDYEDVLGHRGTSEPTYTDVLPAIALNYDLNDRQKLRLSASQTLARPEYREIAPICYRAGLGEEQRCGNPDLRRTLIQNYDLRWEWYPSPLEVISVGLFAKSFQDPIEPRYQGRSGTNSLWFQNAERAVNYGIELEVMRSLGFIAEQLSPLSVFSNARLMNSEVETGIEGDPRRAMTGQAPYVINAGVTYTAASRSTSATILYNVVGARIINARPSGSAVADMLEQPRPMLDLALRFPIFGTMAGKLDLKNLLDSPFEVRQGDVLRQYYRSGRSLSVGLSWQQ
jgi:TonB-dependent receptor